MAWNKRTKRTPAQILADRLRSEAKDAGNEMAWFEAIYKEAGHDPALVPWGHEIVRFPLVDWLARKKDHKGKALDVGCGLGDNAVALAKAGYEVTGFDLSPTAVDWASRRFKDLPIDWQVHDLTAMPASLHGQFDLVTEIFTLQTLKEPYRTRAFRNLAKIPKIGGTLLIICRGVKDGGDTTPPPWPVKQSELQQFVSWGYEIKLLEDHFDQKEKPRLHYLCELKRMS